MTLSGADVRFLLPFPPSAAGAEPHVVAGPFARRRLERAGYRVHRYLALPSVERPLLVLPLEHRRASAYALRTRALPRTAPRRVRRRVLAELVAAGSMPPVGPLVTVGLRRDGPPFFLAAAGSLGVPAESSWFLVAGAGDELSRGVFLVFPPGGERPEWALKFARVPGYREAFDRDEHALELVRETGGPAAAHAPRLIGRFEVDGLAASLESAAPGLRLDDLLDVPGPEGRKLHALEAVAGWTVEVARTTAAAPERLAEERERLAGLVRETGASPALDGELVSRLPPLPAVLQHNDLGAWNVVVDGDSFTAVDWESARRFGLPLWDLWYFAASALPRLEGVPADALEPFLPRLFRGEARSSPLLMAWTRGAVDALAIPRDAVGALAALCWLHHSRSHLAREEALRRHAPSASRLRLVTETMPRLWLSDPALGVGWRAWER